MLATPAGVERVSAGGMMAKKPAQVRAKILEAM
jgi:hypothetical protein